MNKTNINWRKKRFTTRYLFNTKIHSYMWTVLECMYFFVFGYVYWKIIERYFIIGNTTFKIVTFFACFREIVWN